MSKVKFLSTIAVFVLMLLSTGSVIANEDDSLELPRLYVNADRLPGMTGAEWQAFLLEMDGGNWGGGGSGGSGAAGLKEKYCKLVETLGNTMQGALAGAPITGTASTGLSLGFVAHGLVLITLEAAYRDIEHYESNGIRPSVPGGSLINWRQENIDWDYSGYVVDSPVFGAEHVFAGWVKSKGLGDGSSALIDPDPSTDCP